MSHKLTRQYRGDGMAQEITPTCSCGWVGRAESASNDYQMANVREQEDAHMSKPDELSPKIMAARRDVNTGWWS